MNDLVVAVLVAGLRKLIHRKMAAPRSNIRCQSAPKLQAQFILIEHLYLHTEYWPAPGSVDTRLSESRLQFELYGTYTNSRRD